jgi:hypothetical protein
VIYASAALALILPEIEIQWRPGNLNIAVPAGRGRHLTELLSSKPFHRRTRPAFDEQREERAWTKAWNVGSVSAPIIVVESRDSTVLPVILCARTTAQMVAISARRIYCFHASLTLASTAVLGSSSRLKRQVRVHAAKGMTILDTQTWTSPCGSACSGLSRRIRGRRDMGVVTWDDEAQELFALDQAQYKWSLSNPCFNVHCPSHEPSYRCNKGPCSLHPDPATALLGSEHGSDFYEDLGGMATRQEIAKHAEEILSIAPVGCFRQSGYKVNVIYSSHLLW